MTHRPALVARRMFGVVIGVLMLAGCAAQVAGSPGPSVSTGVTAPSPGPSSTQPSDGLPLTWQKTFTSTRFLKISSVRVDGSRQAAFLQQVADEDLRDDMSAALASAPSGKALYAGALDTNCQPSMTPRLRVQADTVVLDTPQKSEFDGECYVAYTSYAIVAVDPADLPAIAATPTR